jgi:1-phosphatidylinositol phosphodiesterase
MSRNWLSNISDEVHLNELVIPGTHDSASWIYEEQESLVSTFTWTQRKNFTEQLNAGVRVLDLRIGMVARILSSTYTDDELHMVHGPRLVNEQSLDNVLKEISTWLRENSGEFVILMFQQQGRSKIDTGDGVQRLVAKNFGNILGRTFFNFDSIAHRWPTVGDLRGRVLVLERLQARVPGYCDVSQWPKNPEGAVFDINNQLKVFVQDKFEKVYEGWSRDAECDEKIKVIRHGIHTAHRINQSSQNVLSIHHSSYSNKRYEPWTTGQIINRKLISQSTPPLVNFDRGIMMIDDATSAMCNYLLQYNKVR